MTFEEEMRERLVRIEAKVEVFPDHEARVRSLEKERWLNRGGIAMITLIAAKLGMPWHL